MRFAAVLLLFVSVACGTSDAEIGPDDTPGASDAGTADGALPPGHDGGGTPDGSNGSDGDVPSGPFCASQVPAPGLCEDWDDGTPPDGATPDVGTGASCAIDSSGFLSSPNSYKCSSPGGAQFVNALLGIPTNAPKTAQKRTVGFAFRPDTALPTTGDLVIARTFVSNNRSITIELSSESGAVVREQSNAIDNHAPIAKKPAVGAWTRYVLAIDLGAKTAKLSANGESVATLALLGNDAGDTALNLGLQASKPFTAHYDDVTIDWQ